MRNEIAFTRAEMIEYYEKKHRDAMVQQAQLIANAMRNNQGNSTGGDNQAALLGANMAMYNQNVMFPNNSNNFSAKF